MDASEPDFNDDPAGWVRWQWERCDTALARQRRDFWLNLSFFEGDQWVVWNDQSREVTELARRNDDDRVRLTANRIQPNLINLLAKFMRRELGFEVPAEASDDSAISGARLAEHILEATYTEQMWSLARIEGMLNAFLGGTSFIAVEWDPSAGEQLSHDPETGKVIGTGDIRLEALNIAEAALEPGTANHKDARFWMRCQAYPPKQIQERYGLDHEPDADAAGNAGSLQRKLWSQRGFAANVPMALVFTYYERPTKANPKGKYAVVCNDECLVDRPWPFPFSDRLNIYPFRQTPLPAKWYGHTIVSDALPLQAGYNHFLSLIHEHMKHAANARLAIPNDSGVDVEDLSDRPGEALLYDGQASQAPHWLQPATIDRSIVDHGNRLEEKIDDLMYVHDISRGEAPGDRNSGLALSVLAEKDETPMAVMSEDQATGWSEIGTMVLKIYEKKAIEPRDAVVLSDSGVPVQRKWTGVMLRGQTRAKVPLQNVMPHSKAATQAWIMDLIQKAPTAIPLNPALLAKLLDLPNVSMFEEMVDGDTSQAQRENALMASGEVPWLGDKPFPVEWDNHAIHIAEHNRFRKSPAYINAGPDVRQIVDMHVQAHERMNLMQVMQQAQVNAQAPGMGALPQGDAPPGSMVPLPAGTSNPTAPPPNGIPPAAPQAGPPA